MRKRGFIGENNFPVRCIAAVFVLLLIFAGTAHHRVYSINEGPLWQKAVEIASANDNWVPGHVVHFEEVYSRLGILQETIETHSALYRYEGRDVECEFLRVIRNGRDITEEFKKEFYESIILEEHEYKVEHPFNVSSQLHISYRRRNNKKIIDGKRCVLYEFTYINEKGKWQGTAWLDESSGVPVIVRGTLQSVPLEEKWYTISRLVVTTAFTYNGSGDWYPEEVIVDSRIEVGDKLFQTYKSRIKETYRLSEHWKYE